MPKKNRIYLSFLSGLITLGVLIAFFSPGDLGGTTLLNWGIFCGLLVLTSTFGIPLGGGSISLLPLISVTALLSTGISTAAWAAFAAALIHGAIRWLFARQLGEQSISPLDALNRALTNASMLTFSILGGGLAYLALGGQLPLESVTTQSLPSLLGLAVSFMGINYLLAGLYMALAGESFLSEYLRSISSILVNESLQMLFAPLAVMIFTGLGTGWFLFFSAALAAFMLVSHRLSVARSRLERQLKEIHSLQAVGQVLSASLRQDVILDSIYIQLVELMPVEVLFVAFYDPERSEISFPLVVEGGARKWRQSRPLENGLIEHVLNTRESLLVQKDFEKTLRELHLDLVSPKPKSWMGVPMLAGSQLLGVIVLQSYTAEGVYDPAHLELLQAIAAQAAVAIQNARMYSHTDEALRQRVQELDSIFRTTTDGMLLIDQEGKVVAFNESLAGYLGISQSHWIGKRPEHQIVEGGMSLLDIVHYPLEDFISDRVSLLSGELPAKKVVVHDIGVNSLHFERSLAPVYDKENEITGWLLVFRDITEEINLSRLKDDLTHMLVHDLRSPLSTLNSSMSLLKYSLPEENPEAIEYVEIAQTSTERMLMMVNNLLDINRLENQQVPLKLQKVSLPALIQEVTTSFRPSLHEANINLMLSIEENLPPLQADPGLLGRVITNLVDNAIKFTPDGGEICIEARLDPEVDTPAMILRVRDNGTGIPEEERNRIFQKFSRLKTTYTRRPGSGLGLAFCKLVVESHGGKIWVESEYGKGSLFNIRIPV